MKRLVRPESPGLLAFIFVFGILCSQAQAALGEKEDSIDIDRAALSATAGVSVSHGPYNVKELASSRARVREYVRPDGTVFGVAWSGRAQPDLASLLGSYYTEYQSLNAAARPSGPHVRGSRRTLQGSRLIVERFGHMGAIRGRAYIPSLVPSGVSVHDIK